MLTGMRSEKLIDIEYETNTSWMGMHTVSRAANSMFNNWSRIKTGSDGCHINNGGHQHKMTEIYLECYRLNVGERSSRQLSCSRQRPAFSSYDLTQSPQ